MSSSQINYDYGVRVRDERTDAPRVDIKPSLIMAQDARDMFRAAYAAGGSYLADAEVVERAEGTTEWVALDGVAIVRRFTESTRALDEAMTPVLLAGLAQLAEQRLRYLVWSNEHQMWWRPAERGYTDSIEEAGRYPYGQAAAIVGKASVDGRLLRDRTNPLTGEQYRQAPEVLVLAPECIDLLGGVTRG